MQPKRLRPIRMNKLTSFKNIVKTIEANAYYLADMAVEETGLESPMIKHIRIMQPQPCFMMKLVIIRHQAS